MEQTYSDTTPDRRHLALDITTGVSFSVPVRSDDEIMRDALAGNLGLDAIPNHLRAVFEKMVRSMRRQSMRAFKRSEKASQHRQAALAGGGKREVARRRKQMFNMRLNADNGYFDVDIRYRGGPVS